MRRILPLILILALAACSGTVTTSPPGATAAPTASPLAQLQTFTLADLQAANADALAQTPPDTTSSQCYAFLINVIPTLPNFSASKPVGAIMAFQKLRDLKNGATNSSGVLKSLNLACAPLVIDVQTTVNLLAVQLGGAAAGASVGIPALPVLP